MTGVLQVNQRGIEAGVEARYSILDPQRDHPDC